MGSQAGGRTTRRHALGASMLALGGLLAGRVAAASAHRVQPWPADKPTPDLVLPDLDGRDWRLSARRGQVVVVNFWATWCEPCRAEMPSLRALHDGHRAEGLAVVTVNYKEGAPAIRQFLQAGPLDLTVLLDTTGDTAGAWTPRVFPTTVLVDRTGNARTVIVGGLDWAGADALPLLQPLLAARRPV